MPPHPGAYMHARTRLGARPAACHTQPRLPACKGPCQRVNRTTCVTQAPGSLECIQQRQRRPRALNTHTVCWQPAASPCVPATCVMHVCPQLLPTDLCTQETRGTTCSRSLKEIGSAVAGRPVKESPCCQLGVGLWLNSRLSGDRCERCYRMDGVVRVCSPTQGAPLVYGASRRFCPGSESRPGRKSLESLSRQFHTLLPLACLPHATHVRVESSHAPTPTHTHALTQPSSVRAAFPAPCVCDFKLYWAHVEQWFLLRLATGGNRERSHHHYR